MSIPTGADGIVKLQPGESETIAYVIRNASSSRQDSVTLPTRVQGAQGAIGEYVFTMLTTSRCGTFAPAAPITVDYLDAHEEITCTLRVTRNPSSINDIIVGFCVSQCSLSLSYTNAVSHFGDLPDLSLTSSLIEPVSVGAESAVVRLSARHTGSQIIPSLRLLTQCAQFEGGIGPTSPFLIENDFPGACPSLPALGCLNFTGQTYRQLAFSIGNITPNSEASCLLRLRFHSPLAAAVSLDMMAPTIFIVASGGGSFDPDGSNNIAPMGAAPSTPYSPVHVPAVGTLASLTLASLLGWYGYRRRSKPAMN